LIPMRQLHIPVYERELIINMVGSEEQANELAVEFLRQAPEVIDVISESIDCDDWGQVLGCGVMLGKMADATGASQIRSFAQSIVEESLRKDTSPDKLKLLLALIVTSLEQFSQILANYADFE